MVVGQEEKNRKQAPIRSVRTVKLFSWLNVSLRNEKNKSYACHYLEELIDQIFIEHSRFTSFHIFCTHKSSGFVRMNESAILFVGGIIYNLHGIKKHKLRRISAAEKKKRKKAS